MAKYLIGIYGDEQQWDSMTEQERQRIDAGHRAFHATAGAAVLAGGELMSTVTATSLRGSGDGAPTVTDGPFLETKEVLGGFYLIEAADLDAAVALARLLPENGAGHSGVEIRPMTAAS
ncbi:YciI family protein [Nakamurella lactea]|uniref:YciI family protein n=1 Tax=Nakamurella lactea TaxID=459515 RepID=UPI0004150F55|nr:YciI family protein [Nakamurella lactea]